LRILDGAVKSFKRIVYGICNNFVDINRINKYIKKYNNNVHCNLSKVIGVDASPLDVHTNNIIEKEYNRNNTKNNFLISTQEGIAQK